MRLPCCVVGVKTKVKLLFVVSIAVFLLYWVLLKVKVCDDDTSLYMEREGMIANRHAFLLTQIGFRESPRLYPQAYQEIPEKEWPIFVLPLHPKDVESNLIDFLLDFREYFLDHRLVERRCYCQVRFVLWKAYPEHVKNLQTDAYLPLLIQETLMEFGSVFWCDVRMRFVSSQLKPEVSSQAFMFGVSAWSRDTETTAVAVPANTLRYFNMNPSNISEQPLVYPIPALYYNVPKLQCHDALGQVCSGRALCETRPVSDLSL